MAESPSSTIPSRGLGSKIDPNATCRMSVSANGKTIVRCSTSVDTSEAIVNVSINKHHGEQQGPHALLHGHLVAHPIIAEDHRLLVEELHREFTASELVGGFTREALHDGLDLLAHTGLGVHGDGEVALSRNDTRYEPIGECDTDIGFDPLGFFGLLLARLLVTDDSLAALGLVQSSSEPSITPRRRSSFSSSTTVSPSSSAARSRASSSASCSSVTPISMSVPLASPIISSIDG